MTDTQIMALWLIPDLCDWRSHERGLMGNEVTSDHGKVLSFYLYTLSFWEDWWWVHPYSVREYKMRNG